MCSTFRGSIVKIMFGIPADGAVLMKDMCYIKQVIGSINKLTR